VEANAETYMRQFFKIVDRSKTEARYQSEWFGSFDLEQVVRLTSKFTVAQFLAREDFGNRYREGRPIAITELLYPLLQAYDSVQIESDVEFGGMDQKFNLLVGRDLQVMEGQRPQQCFMVPLLVGMDGVQKMSKSLGNYIGVDEPPQETYGKVMSVRDDMILNYFELVTDVDRSELDEMREALDGESVNPMDLKKRLAREIVGQFHDDAAVRDAETRFERVVQRGETPEEMETVSLADVAGGSLSRVLVRAGLASSAAEAKRLISQGAVEKNDQRITADYRADDLRAGDTLRVGRHRFARVVDGESD
jgi:tyrosyl-tRNA synthetase